MPSMIAAFQNKGERDGGREENEECERDWQGSFLGVSFSGRHKKMGICGGHASSDTSGTVPLQSGDQSSPNESAGAAYVGRDNEANDGCISL